MKSSILSNKIFSVLFRRKALRTAVWLLVSLFGSSSVFAQTTLNNAVRLLDTVRFTDAFDRTFQFREVTTCMNRSANPFTIDLLVQRAGGMATDSSWGSRNVNWTFPTGGWTVTSTRRGSNTAPNNWDTITLSVPYSWATEANVVKGGNFSAVWNNPSNGNPQYDISINIPLKPAAGEVDTIFTEFPLCQGVNARFWVNSNNSDDDPYLTQFASQMIFVWNVLGANGRPIAGLGNSPSYTSETTFTIHNFNPAVHKAVTVQRGFCNTGFVINEDITLPKELKFDEDKVVSNPPLDTAAGSREDTLYRIVFRAPSETDPPRWTSVRMRGDDEHPVCVNYSRTLGGTQQNYVNLTPSSDGYLFFQVGTKMDTMVRYIWGYDTALLERVYVNVPTPNVSGGGNWWTAGGTRWQMLIDETEVADGIPNHGWWGQERAAGVRIADSTYRAAFRVKPLSEAARAAHIDSVRAANAGNALANYNGKILISVLPVCLSCTNTSGPLAGQPFQNRRLSDSLDKPLDTVKPMSDFYIETIRNTPAHAVNPSFPDWDLASNSVSDTACAGTTLSFRAVANQSMQNSWNRDSLLHHYNITHFRAFAGGAVEFAETYTPGTTTGSSYIKPVGTVDLSDVNFGNRDIWTSWRTFTPVNYCFARRLTSVVSVPNSTAPDEFQLSEADKPWHQIITFWAKRLARAPKIIDPITGDEPSIVFLCKNALMTEDGDGHQRDAMNQLIRGVQYVLQNDNANLVKNPGTAEYPVPRTTPFTTFHGFHSPIGESGNPIGMGWQIDDYVANDPLQRTSVRIWPADGFSGPEEGEFIFAAQDMCGRGDPLTVPYVIMDTISAVTHVTFTYNRTSTDVAEWENLGVAPCENTTVFIRIEDNDNPDTETYTRWWYPNSWKGTSGQFTGGGAPQNQLELVYGKDSGQIGVNMVNRCGGSKRVQSPKIVPIPYYRTDGNWLSFYPDVCQDSVYYFTLKNEPHGSMHDLYIRFPNNWRILGNITGDPLAHPKENRDTIRAISLTNRLHDVPWRVWVADSIGNFDHIVVRWLNPLCDTSAFSRPALWDTSQMIRIHTQPIKPEKNGIWPDTVCLRDTIWFGVKPAPKDSVQNNKYEWILPASPDPGSGWKIVASSPNFDSVRVIVGATNLEVDTIRVRPLSSRCTLESPSENDIVLKVPIVTRDTAVFELDLILDAATGIRFGQLPCINDTLKLFVNRPYSVDSVDWRWGSTANTLGHSVTSGTNIWDGWFFASGTGLPDTLAITPQSSSTAPLFVQANMFNKCGRSRSEIIRMGTAAVVTGQNLFWTEFTDTLCEGETATYEATLLSDADRYVWSFPWEPYRDTVWMNHSRTMTPKATGIVSVFAANNCSQSNSTSDSTIALIRSAPKAPIATNFGSGTTIIDGTTWLLDTVCLRRTIANPWIITPDPTDGVMNLLPFEWTQLGGDVVPNTQIFDFTTPQREEVYMVGVNTNIRRYNTQIGVAARRTECTVTGDTLRILLTSVDTIQLEKLGGISVNFPYSPFNPCPGSVYTFRVLQDSAFAYRWILPDTSYKFLSSNPIDQARSSVQIVIGNKPAPIGVLTMTGPTFNIENNYCPYQNSDTLWSELISPRQGPTLDYFIGMIDTLCQNEEITLTAVANAGTSVIPQMYRWVFPQGWLANNQTDTITTNASITVKAAGTGGKISVFGRDNCEGYINEGEPIEDSVYVFAMPRVRVVGNVSPCQESLETYNLVPSDRWINYNLRTVSLDPATTVEAERPTDNRWDIDVRFGTTGVRFVFSNITHSRCPALHSPNDSTNIFAFTSLPLRLSVNGVAPSAVRTDTVCMGVEYRFVAFETNGNAKEFIWNLPPLWATNTTLSGALNDTLRVRFNSLLPDNENLGMIELRGRTECYVDTAVYRKPIMMDTIALPSPILDANKGNQPFFQQACENDTLILFVQKNPRYDTVFWHWNGGRVVNFADSTIGTTGWRHLDPEQALRGDTLALIVPAVEGNELDISIGIRNQCGVVKIYNYTLTSTKPITTAPTFALNETQVCFGEKTRFVLHTTPANASAYYWNFSWTSVADTIHNSPEHNFIVPQPGEVWVFAVNGCGVFKDDSALIVIDEVFSRPNKVVPTNFALDGLVGRDTFCLRASRTLTIEKNSGDDLIGINEYDWFYISGDSITPMSGTGTSFTINADLTTPKIGKRTTIGVAAIRNECNERGDTLQIDLIMVDTVPSAWLGAIEPIGGTHCPLDTLVIQTTHNVIPAYLFAPPSYVWTSLEPTWKIIGSDTNSIKVVIGENPGMFSVTTLTGFSCLSENRAPILSEPFERRERPILDEFNEILTEICSYETQRIGVVLNHESRADAYRFTFYQHKSRSTEIDTIAVIETEPVHNYELFDWKYDSIRVAVEAIDSSCTFPIFSLPLTRMFHIYNSPQVFLVGDTMPCFDSVKTYIIERSDPYVTFEFAYSLVPDGPIPPTEVPSGMIEIFPAGSTQPDSIRVHFADKGIDIRFTNIQSTACPLLSGSEGKSYRIKPDTTPTIDFSVTPVDVLACMGDTLKFVAKLNETVGFEASFEWHLPTQNPSVMLRPWRTVGITGEKRDTIRLVAAEYLDGLSSVDTLRVFASGSCGTTRNPEIARIRVEAAPVYHINIQSDHDQFRPGTIRQICENETLKVWADTLGLGLNFLSVRWDYPNSPNVEGNDTLNLTIPAGSFTLHARFYAAGTCGYSTPTSSLRVMVDNLPAVPQSRYAPWPCKEDDFEMNTLRDYWTDSIVWEWDENFNGSMPPDFFVVETSQNGLPSVTGSPTKNDSLYFKNVGISPFRLIATGWNHCGPRQDTILFTPSDSITPIPTDAFANFGSLRFCSGNEVVGALKIPFQHTNTRPNYIWTFNEDWTLVKDSINKADETLMVWFIPGTSAGTMSVFADSRGCGITDPVISENFRPTVLRLKATQSAETTLYGDASVSIFVNPNDVGMVSQPDNNQGTGEFNVVFLPLDRFTITGDQSVALNFAYLTNEEFVVKATEKSAPFGQLCWITDTVYLHVEGSYRFSVGYHDSVCLNSDFPLNAIHTGGEPTTYLQRWFKLDSEGTPVEISQHIEVTQPITTLGDMHFWAVGSSWLRTGVGPLETAPGERFFDTIPFTVKSIDSIIARIETVESVRIIGNRVDVARELYPIFDSVLLGEKLRITGVVERRPAGYPHFLFEWDAAEISDSASEFAGFSPEPGDTNVAFTGLIFSPQMFYFAVHDTTAYGCFSMDSVLIGVRQLTGNKNDFVEIPGAFTPHNQDGINDIFMKNVDEITIFNRWGVVIFEAKGPEAQKGWDGRYPKTGRMVDKGDYFYIITIYEHNDKTKKSTKTGVVTVI